MFTWIASHPWAYPALEVLHIVGIALLLGNLVLLEIRVWGGAATLPLPALAGMALPLVLAGFGLCAASGLQRLDRAARLQTVLSLGIWLTVIILGRSIAYL